MTIVHTESWDFDGENYETKVIDCDDKWIVRTSGGI